MGVSQMDVKYKNVHYAIVSLATCPTELTAHVTDVKYVCCDRMLQSLFVNPK